MYVWWGAQRSEEGVGSLELGLQTVVNHYAVTGYPNPGPL